MIAGFGNFDNFGSNRFEYVRNFAYICTLISSPPPQGSKTSVPKSAQTTMKAKKKYKITIEDESRLRQIASVSATPVALWSCGILGGILLVFVCALLIMATPIRTLMPGYLKKGERTEAEEGLLRLDSIRDAYQANAQYLSNILNVLNTDRTPTDSLLNTTDPNELPPDSLLPASPREIEFITRLKDREEYNVSILAPLAADQLRIYPVGVGATVAEQSPGATRSRVTVPKGSAVCAIADGRVLAIQNPAPEGGCAIVLQHDGGFASRYSHTGTPTVSPGMRIDGGSVIAHGATGGALSPGVFYLEMWYDGTPVDPARYLGGSPPAP